MFEERLKLPIWTVHQAIRSTLATANRLVLTAPTGSGKSTQVPGMLLDDELVRGQVIVLQPRRLAARVLAQRVAQERGSRIGEEVGYQTRHESKISSHTRLRFVTEGLFLRLLQSQPTLPEVGAVVLDEFHERNLPADLALALVKQLQSTTRPDLKLLVMSATLATQPVAEYLQSPILEARGRLYPVETRYLSQKPAGHTPIWETAAWAVEGFLRETEDTKPSPSAHDHADARGDILVFMPGVFEIRKTIETCRRLIHDRSVTFAALYAEMPAAEQDAVFRPMAAGHRKVIVATNIAETSITLPRVTAVVDSGLVRMQRMDHRRGINVLVVEPISQASADQRAGRAGRTAPGVCIRLWTVHEQGSRPSQTPPEILRVDLAQAVLQVLSMDLPGVTTIRELSDFPWLERPGDLAMQQAASVLTWLEALDARGHITPMGRAMAKLPMHPRLARMMLEADKLDCVPQAALWAALISERDILSLDGWRRWAEQTGESRSDFAVLEAAYRQAERNRFDVETCSPLGIHVSACRQVQRTAELYQKSLEDGSHQAHPHPSVESRHAGSTKPHPRHQRTDPPITACLLAGYPDHLAVYKGKPHRACVLLGQRRGVLDENSVTAAEPGVILAVEVMEIGGQRTAARRAARDSALLTGGPRTQLSLATRIDPTPLQAIWPQHVHQEKVAQWNDRLRCVELVEQLRFEDLILEEKSRGSPVDGAQAAALLAEKIMAGEIKLTHWDESCDQWIARVRCLSQWFPQRRLLRYDDDDWRVIYQEWCEGSVRASQVEDKPVLEALQGALSWEDRQWVERMTPTSLKLPGVNKKGQPLRMKIRYKEGQPPTGRAKIQELYGLMETPTIADGRVKLRLEILGPNFRPLQITEDLAGFWANLYPTLKKELQRKYPRHEWR